MHKPCIDIIWSRSLGDYLMLKGKPFAVRPSISMEGWNLAIKAAFGYTIDILFSLKKNIRWNTRYIISIICHMYGNVSRTTAVQIWIFKSPIRCSTYYSFFFFFLHHFIQKFITSLSWLVHLPSAKQATCSPFS